METKAFFETFGHWTVTHLKKTRKRFWNPVSIDVDSFSIEQLYQQFIKRYHEELRVALETEQEKENANT
jgi:hypothetical protein